ncbi:hypothetical protein GWG54_12230 [Natronococcus sp. JC468]|uniref:DUF7344 domain-containing protein n=1 Tax=Natronococcus sp. JC468 TaxID=1961921 RepID=UPI001439C0F3|nr:hypothetical protein [Natronococcus sp. JC468]NKE36573.1 hypothetical protein [Natronococcus sp. JC468]
MGNENAHQSQNTDVPLTESTSETRALSDNEIFHLLSNSRRRETIRYLLETRDPLSVPELARYLVAAEQETPIGDVTREQYQQVFLSLSQSHLPALDTVGVIQYDQSQDLVEPTARLEAFVPYLDPPSTETDSVQSTVTSPESEERAFDNWYLVAAGISVILLLAVTARLISIPGELVGWLIIGLFLAATAATKRIDSR